jgi:cytochrome P450
LAVGFFTRQRIDGLRDDVEKIAAELLDGIAGAGTMEIVADFAYPLPARVMARLLGMPEDDCGILKNAFLQLTHGVDRGEIGPGGDAVMAELTDYFDALAADKRRRPGDDLISVLLAAEARGEMTAEEVTAAAILYMWTGHETTKNLIGNTVVALLRYPDQMAALIANSDLAARTVSEVLRYESPVQRAGRWTLADVEIGGVEIPEGQYVSGIIGAAHRDPAYFTDPGRFDIRRKPGPLLAFGRGAHYCLGHGLARLEGEIALTALLRRTGMLAPAAATVDTALAWQASTSIRGLERLAVTFSPQG